MERRGHEHTETILALVCDALLLALLAVRGGDRRDFVYLGDDALDAPRRTDDRASALAGVRVVTDALSSLREQNDILREEVRQLKAERGLGLFSVQGVTLPHTLLIILMALLRSRRPCSLMYLTDCIGQFRAHNDGSLASMPVHVSRLRKALREGEPPFDPPVHIAMVEHGYQIPAEDKARILKRLVI